ncbi:CBS domain-containing protein [Paenibacillaceae bacterium GAS479]|nr:CBS domain-containing protein [Paenibacillaceae bacterium GAS479]
MTDPGWQQLLHGIAHADDSASLHRLRELVHDRMVARLPLQGTERFYAELNDAHDAFVRRAIQLAQFELARLGKGVPPVPFAYLLFGSGGRREQTLLSDQDSGIIYADSLSEAEQEKSREYFTALSDRIVQLLLETGYPLCEGNVLSSNKEWCRSLSSWRVKLNGWFEEPAWEAVRYLLIVADSRCVYGEMGLHNELKDDFYGDVIRQPIIVKRMLENTMKHKVLLNIFGQLLREQYGEDAGSIDIKYGAYIPMVNAIRLLAIEANLREASTLDRIRSLEKLGLVQPGEAAECIETFQLFLGLRMMTTEKIENGQYTTNGKLSSSKLSKEMAEKLKNGLRLGKKLQRKVYRHTMSRL